jgi:hypothetical protein
MKMSNSPRLIIPHSDGSSQERVGDIPDNRPRFNLPQEMKDEVRKFIPEAKEAADKVRELLGKGPAAQVAFVCQESTRNFLGEHIKSLLPQMVRTFAQTDRMQILGFFRQIADQRLSPANLSAERIDKKTYELAIHDFMNLISKVPAQIFPVEVGLPDLDLDDDTLSESEGSPPDTSQGES